MTQKLTAALAAAMLLCTAAGSARAQDAGEMTTTPKSEKKMHKMDACKDDVAKLCPDAKGHKAIHNCLDQHKDELSPACKEHHERMERHWRKMKAKRGGEEAPSGEGPAGAAPAGGTPPPSNP